MAANDLNLKLTLSADGKQLSGSLKTAQGEVRAFGVKAEQAGAVATNSFSKTRKGVESISAQLQRAQSAALAFIGVSQGLAGVGSVIKIADDYGEMAKRVQMATTSSEDYQTVQERLLQTAGGTYRALSEAQELYIQTADALRSLGYNTEQQLDITDSLSYAFVVNSTSAEKAGAAINAFSRSIQTGKVSALDWQSVLMATPTIVNDIAAATSKATAEIRALGVQGKLGLGELTEGLRLSRDANQALADGMDTTVADAFTRLRTNFSAYIGEANQTHQATQKLSAGIVVVAENLDVVANVAMVGLIAVTGRYIGLATMSAVATIRANTAHAAAVTSVGLHANALRILTTAQTTAATAGRALLGIMGGPVGLAVTAAAVAVSFIDWGKSAKDAAAGNDLLKQSVDKLTAAQARQRLNQLEGGYQAAQKETKILAARVEYLNVKLSQFPSAKNADKWRKSLEDAEGSLDTAKQKVEEYNTLQQRLNDIINKRQSVTPPNLVDPNTEKNIASIVDGLAQQHLQLRLNEEQYLRYKMAAAGATLEQINSAAALHQSTAALKEQKKAKEDAAAKVLSAKEAQEEWVWSMIDAIDPALELEEQIRDLQDAMDGGLFGDLDEDKFKKYIDSIKKKLAELNGVKIEDPAKKLGGAMQTAAGGLRDVAGAMQGMHEQGTRGYQEMAVAMQATNVLAAIGAVLEQGKGDPYTAFARMAAMAAAVTALGVQVSMMGGDWPDDAAKQQAVQGTGTVLGDSTAKSESIAHSVDVTAAATSQLVGINRDMLRALQSMQAGISNATVRIARGAKNVDFGEIYKPTNAFDLVSDSGLAYMSLPGAKQLDQLHLGIYSAVFSKVGKLLGGSSKVTDQGIRILGGSMAEMLEGVTVEAYQTVKSKKYKWSSSKTRENYQDLGDDVSNQFRLVFESLADSVYAGAVALGLSGDEVEKKINEFTIATQKISTKGLTAEEQQKEIEAVFSSIFDGLAGSVVTFLPKFQQAGEGLGETLARVATNVQVTEEAVNRLGFQAQRLGAEQFAELSVALIEAAGGLENFINGMGAFVDKFASDKKKFELASSDMERALAQVGLTVPGTREGMWGLMQSLDASTESGRAQIAALLELTSTSDAYYKMLEDHNKTLQGLLGDDKGDALADYFKELSDYVRAESQAIEQDYKERIKLLERQSNLSKQLGDYVAKLRLSDLSPAGPAEKLAQAGDEFAALLVRAQAGDLEAATKLQGAADTYLKNADAYYGRSDVYIGIFDDVAKQLEDLGLALGATSTEEHIKSLNEQMLAEQQQQRDLLQAELDWAVAQYSKLTSIEQLLSSLPGNIGATINGQLKPNDTAAPERPDRPAQEDPYAGINLGGIGTIDISNFNFGIGPMDLSGLNFGFAPNMGMPDYSGLANLGYTSETVNLLKGLNGSHADGLAHVPFDGYVAELHKGEAVLTASENRDLARFDLSPLLSEIAQLRAEVGQLRAERSADAAKAERQRSEQVRATESVARNTRTAVGVL